LNQRSFHKLISGQSKGFEAGILRFFLRMAAGGYSTAVELRNSLYSKGWLKTHQINTPVISVGNITTGGTGKTPLVIWLCNLLHKMNINCAILTRGYKAIQNYSDEPAIFAESCPQAKVVINPDRIAGANEAIEKHGAKVLIMDDGFQHRRLARDIDIVTIDATCPFGYGKILPAGLLREPASTLKRADAIVLTRCDHISQNDLDKLEQELKRINPDMVIARSIHSAICIKLADCSELDIEQLKGKKVFAFCGIGNPDAFFETIKALGVEIPRAEVYDDHHHYTDKNIGSICKQAKQKDADLILTTQKDWTKITPLDFSHEGITFGYLAIELRFIAGEEKITHLIEKALEGKIIEN
jgi:tetraacyldisaccharide 4'-kinase